jgi:hypothetical protein
MGIEEANHADDVFLYRILGRTHSKAGPVTGYSEGAIKEAIAAGELTPRYANSKQVILRADL